MFTQDMEGCLGFASQESTVRVSAKPDWPGLIITEVGKAASGVLCNCCYVCMLLKILIKDEVYLRWDSWRGTR